MELNIFQNGESFNYGNKDGQLVFPDGLSWKCKLSVSRNVKCCNISKFLDTNTNSQHDDTCKKAQNMPNFSAKENILQSMHFPFFIQCTPKTQKNSGEKLK